jgi:hypothetical protein
VNGTSHPEVVAYYSVVRYVPDQFRDEPINVGLVMATADGEWSRFRVLVPKTRLWAIGRRDDVDAVERWARIVEATYTTRGYRGVFGEFGQLNVETVREWSNTFGASIRLSEPRVAVDSTVEQLWAQLFAALVRGRTTDDPMDGLLTARRASRQVRRPRDARAEQRQVISEFVTAARAWPTFDPRLLLPDATFEGLRATHLADLALRNGHLTGIVQVLPVASGTVGEVITKRALLLEAALDVAPSVAKLAVYLDPPAERRELLEETLAVIGQYPGEGEVTPVPARNFDDLEPRFGRVLFPELLRG